MSKIWIRSGRPSWKKYSYDEPQTPNIADGQLNIFTKRDVRTCACFSGFKLYSNCIR